MNNITKTSLLAAILLISHGSLAAEETLVQMVSDTAAGSVSIEDKSPEKEGHEEAIFDESTLEEIVVTADFRDIALLNTGNSITVIDSATIALREARHLEQVLNLSPNVNYSSGASRGRFIQIRGIGERSQFIEPLNPSVGLLIDGIDFSGIGGAATTLDLKQIEILRGPQGTLYGANALAGLVNLTSNDPTESFEGSVETSVAEYETRTVNSVISGPMTENLGYRLAVQQHKSDGYTDNDFLNRHDTNNIDEQAIRGKLNWQVNDELQVKLTGFYTDVDNGYDGFSLDNTRHTLSNQPGKDSQESTAVGIETIWQATAQFDVVGSVSYVDSDLEYSFDEDWSYDDICAGEPCDGWAYSSFDSYQRDRDNGAVDLRLVSREEGRIFNDTTDWVGGIYYRAQDESLLREYTSDFTSDFETENHAVYGQLGSQLTDSLRLITGLRLEYRDADYDDSDSVNHDNGDRLWGGRIGLEYHIADDTMVYGLVSRGYKAGGVNSNSELAPSAREFDTEYMWNFETGIKGDWLDRQLQVQLVLFYQKRHDMQVKQSLLTPNSGDDCPCSFTDFFDNAAKGENYGLELESNWLATDWLTFYGSLGLLKAKFKDFDSFSHSDADAENGVSVDLSSREQAHAPSYQFSVGAELALSDNWMASVEVEGKDEFYLSPRHDEKTNSYELINARLHYQVEAWELSLWGRNLTDKDVIVRGFGSFGNDPRKFYETEPYYQFGEPKIFGATAKYHF